MRHWAKRPALAAGLWAATVSGVWAIGAGAARADDWEDSFSKSEHKKGDKPGASDEDDPDPAGPAMTAETTLSSSFPMRLEYGTLKDPDWGKAPPSALAPRKIRKKLKVGKCAFSVETGTYVVSKYSVSGIGEYAVDTPAYPVQTRIQLVPNESIFLSVSVELEVHPLGGDVSPCKKLFKKKDRRQIPGLVLGDGLVGHEGQQSLKPVKTVREAQGDKLYISWDKSEKTLRLENQDGVKPMIESPIVKFEAYNEGGYYLTYSPSWKMVRGAKDKTDE